MSASVPISPASTASRSSRPWLPSGETAWCWSAWRRSGQALSRASAQPSGERRLARLLARLDVLVVLEEVLRVVLVLERDQPPVLLLAIGIPNAVALRREVQVGHAGAVRAHRLSECAVGCDDLLIV